jgi:hypothetical protein
LAPKLNLAPIDARVPRVVFAPWTAIMARKMFAPAILLVPAVSLALAMLLAPTVWLAPLCEDLGAPWQLFIILYSFSHPQSPRCNGGWIV